MALGRNQLLGPALENWKECCVPAKKGNGYMATEFQLNTPF
jgi:hypothetical protein